MFHVVTDTFVWRHPELASVDTSLRHCGSHPIALNWSRYEYEADAEHFRATSVPRFCTDLVQALPLQGQRTLVVSDSTIGWHDWGDDAQRSGWASALLASFLPPGSAVDAVNGSGFVAQSRANQHFRARLATRLRRGERYDMVVFVGGWNDRWHSWTEHAVCGCVRMANALLAAA